MKLEFVYAPVPDLGAALALYRDCFGFQEAWREGETTVSLKLPGTDVQVMLDAAEPGSRPGPIFVVDSVADFRTAYGDTVRFWLEPMEIPGGWMAGFDDPGGNAVYVLDQSTDAA